MDLFFPRRGDEVTEAYRAMGDDRSRYLPSFLRSQTDGELHREILALTDADASGYDLSSRMWRIEQVTRELLSREVQQELANEHGWPTQKPRVVK